VIYMDTLKEFFPNKTWKYIMKIRVYNKKKIV